jgi:hypothetical protein
MDQSKPTSKTWIQSGAQQLRVFLTFFFSNVFLQKANWNLSKNPNNWNTVENYSQKLEITQSRF